MQNKINCEVGPSCQTAKAENNHEILQFYNIIIYNAGIQKNTVEYWDWLN